MTKYVSLLLVIAIGIGTILFYVSSRTTTARIFGLSMSPRYCGVHYRVKCKTCSNPFRISATNEKLETTSIDSAICPMCGHVNSINGQQLHEGDLVEVRSVSSNEPTRWQVVAVRDPRNDQSILVKRIIGLPGETIDFQYGDVLVNEEVEKKSIREFLDMAICVSDMRYEPSQNQPTMWSPLLTEKESGWIFRNRSWQHEQRETRNDSLQFVPLAYIPGAKLRSARVTDYNWFDQTSSRPLAPVDDLLLSIVLKELQSTIHLIANDGWHQWKVMVHSTNSIQVWRDDQELLNASDVILSKTDNTIRIGIFDRQLLLEINEAIEYRWDAVAKDRTHVDQVPFQIHVAGSANISELAVWRDLWFEAVGPLQTKTFRGISLSENEFFLVGDYAPFSVDSRSDQIGPAIRSDVIGIVEEISR